MKNALIIAACLLVFAGAMLLVYREIQRQARLASPQGTTRSAGKEDRWTMLRNRMVDSQIAARGVDDPKVLAALRKVERHRFVPQAYRAQSYDDHPLPIGHAQTISQPYIVGLMTQLADLEPTDRVLEVGTGSGYQAAVLAELVEKVFTIEIVRPLGEEARNRLGELGYDNVEVRIGDGYGGWPEQAPFDAILVTAAPERVPQPLVDQLREGGRLVLPVGPAGNQELQVLEQTASGLKTRRSIPVRFVPMTGEAQESR